MNTALKDRLESAKAAQDTGITTTEAKGSVIGWLNAPATSTELVRALPSGMDAGRFARVVQTEVRKNPELLACTPQSFILAVLNAAQLGLEPGPLGFSFLIPLKNNKTNQLECNLWLGYKGLKELAYRGGAVEFIDAVAVHEGEPFRIVRQPDSHLEHEERAECADAAVVAYYAFAVLTGSGRVVFDVMWPKDIEGIKKRSRAGNKEAGPWSTDFEAMALKTVTRRLLNRGKVRLSAQIAEAIHEDEARELGYDKPELLPSLAMEAPAAKASPSATSDEVAKEEAAPSEGAPTEAAPADSVEGQAAANDVTTPVPPTTSEPPAAEVKSEVEGGGPSTSTICQICGLGDGKHDDAKHAEWAKAKRAEKKRAADASLPLEGGS